MLRKENQSCTWRVSTLEEGMVRGAYIASHEQVQSAVGRTNIALKDRYFGNSVLDFAPRFLLMRSLGSLGSTVSW